MTPKTPVVNPNESLRTAIKGMRSSVETLGHEWRGREWYLIEELTALRTILSFMLDVLDTLSVQCGDLQTEVAP